SPDRTFDADGVATAPSPARDLAIDSAGRVVLAGNLGRYPYTPAVARLTESGQPDAAFGGGDGVASFATPLLPYAELHSLVIGPGDRPVVSGSTAPHTSDYDTDLDFFTARLTDDGSPDVSFNGTGYAIDDFFDGANYQ